MARPPHAREKVLDAFEELLVNEGTASMDATARLAGVSKGGLLYHFASKAAMEEALVARLIEAAELDIEEIIDAPDGLVSAFIRTSAETDSPLDRAIIAVSRLASAGSPIAIEGQKQIRTLWKDSLRPHVRNETALKLVMLVADGVYFNNALDDGSVPDLDDLREIIDMVESVTRP